MAWRPHEYLIEGELDNTFLGKVTSWMNFACMDGIVRFNLKGNFHRDIRGAKIHFKGDHYDKEEPSEAKQYMQGFALNQTGKVGDITAGLPPADYTAYPYLEWYSNENGRVVIELESEQVEVIGQPIPAIESDPVPRQQQNENMADYLSSMAKEIGIPLENAIIIDIAQPEDSGLLTPELRQRLPKLYSQEGVDDPVAQAHFYLPGTNWHWYPIEFDGEDLFFGLVIGHEPEVGYFRLSELESVTGLNGVKIRLDKEFSPIPVRSIS